jgi:tetratricopeptide (TPR) repeat protein
MTVLDPEPQPTLEDTQPRVLHAAADDWQESEPRRGCGSRLMVALVVLIIMGMALVTLALAAVAGWRDGGLMRQTQRAGAVEATLDRQATLGWQDLAEQRYELAFIRCDYVATLQPAYPDIRACMSTAQAGLNATPLATATPSPPASTPTPPPLTPMPSLTPPTNPGGFSPTELFARGEEAARRSDYESAVSWLEALRGLDSSYRRSEVESLLLTAYQALGSQYRFEGRLSEMVVVIRKALRINPLSDTDWAFTIDAAELYLSARGYLDAGNIPLAAQVFRRLMEMAPTFSTDTKTLACRAFSAAGDTASLTQFECQ